MKCNRFHFTVPSDAPHLDYSSLSWLTKEVSTGIHSILSSSNVCLCPNLVSAYSKMRGIRTLPMPCYSEHHAHTLSPTIAYMQLGSSLARPQRLSASKEKYRYPKPKTSATNYSHSKIQEHTLYSCPALQLISRNNPVSVSTHRASTTLDLSVDPRLR